jgi:recombination protein RecA
MEQCAGRLVHNTDDILSKLKPDLRKMLTVGSNFEVVRQPTPSIMMNRSLRGGFAYGRQVLIYGSKSAGKSTFCLQLIAKAQKDGKVCAWIDSENSFDPNWAQRLGVDTDAIIVSRAHKVNDMVDVGAELMKAGVDVLVVDSISALMPAVYFDKSDELKDLSDTKQMGAMARDMANAMTMLNYANSNTLVILISQQRKALGSMFVKNIPTGGEAVKFFSSTIVRLFSSDSENQSVKSKIDVGGKKIEVNIGREVNWLIDANKLGPAFESGKYRLLFAGDEIGVDSAEEIVSALEAQQLVERRGAWFTVLEQQFQGRESIVNAVRADSEFRAKAEGLL